MVLNILNSYVKIKDGDVLDCQFTEITIFIPLWFLTFLQITDVFKSGRVKSHDMLVDWWDSSLSFIICKGQTSGYFEADTFIRVRGDQKPGRWSFLTWNLTRLWAHRCHNVQFSTYYLQKWTIPIFVKPIWLEVLLNSVFLEVGE